MASIYEAAVMASILVGMVSIPSASGDLEVAKSVSGNLSAISSSEVPTSEVSRVTAGGFYREVQNAFQSFRATTTSSRTNITLDSPGSELEVVRESGRKEFILESPSGRLELTLTPESRVTTVTTPEGTLVTSEENGKVSEEFTGSDREAVEQTAANLRELLQEKRSAVEEQAESMRQASLPDVNLEIEPEGDEYVRLQSLENTEIDLDGWTIRDGSGTEYEFGDVALAPGDTLTLYTGDGQDSSGELYWGTSSVWNNDGDTATLEDSTGNIIVEETY